MKSINGVALLTLLSLAACGGSGDSGSSSSSNDNGNRREYVVASSGTYYTVLRPITFHSNGFIPYGAATFKLKDNELQVSVSMDDDQSVTHRQSLHAGSRCPTAADDTNGDSFIDYNEAMAVVGEVLMPLDADINTHAGGAEIYPRGPAMTYNKYASLLNVNSDLQKIMGKSIGFEGRVVLVHGTSNSSSFPSSIATRSGEASNVSLPVVCGVLEKTE